ncbi:MFS transporter family glucose-6-phosphate receptor UhpC [Providencia vermicola]|uniref:MFS transporter family glucose-6-phosphate receptor UhpC n=1 Tax=Providencia vermicola TaxID=333965 RepID=A0AAX3S1L3_9GAMM|nr:MULTISPECIES: MFS transporter family glucose-6-phosphate receptor UhpC [Providencia]ELX8379824.1 MFS transporter family glucose-6-phosphate receptor UhpC [Providencia stuartii]EMD5259214.1 MFS transporter family glucose-6-phosphate receptor UhpC [Providencia stuartii]MBG5920690.1 MFS transporter family glucose-6-phosphate receptor UhpC [Providencia stuartii]USB38307.1 MFS transporter family glucose-6-phosphate receptor UhpC [Providencia vermicola]WBA56670.1 MFS transporter family glucose-6-
MFRWIKTLPDQPPITDKKEIDKLYRYWRIHIMIALYAGYATYYFTRKSFNYVMPEMIKDLGISISDVGILTTAFYLVYGISRFASGIMSDASNPRFFMGVGLIITGFINIFFGMSSSLWLFTFFWVLNAFFQGWGWPPCSKSLTSWYSRNERGLWWSICNTSHNVGGAIIPLLAGGLAVHYGWRYGMYIPGIIAIVVGLFVCLRLRDKPSTMGLPTVGHWRNDELELQQEASSRKLKLWPILVQYIFTNKYVWLLAISYILVYIVRIGLNDWTNLYLVEEYGYDLIKANSALSFLEVGGFIGTLVAGWGSDFFFKGNRTPMNIIFMIGIGVVAAFLWLFPEMGYLLISVCFFFVGFFIFGPQMLIGMAAAEASHKDSAGAATGFVGLFGYLGAALSGYPLAKIIETAGWNGFFMTMIIATLLSAVLLLPLLIKKK